MKFQWSLLFGLLFAIIIALFAVYNVDAVPVNYVFGTAQWPLILVILGSALLGALLSGTVAIYRSFILARKVKHLEKELELKDASIGSLQNELVAQNNSKQSSFGETVIEKDNNTTI
jgi:putative membrane protein